MVNQYLFIDDSAEILRKFEQTARNMHSLSRYSRSNQINREWIEEYLNEAHSKGLTSIRAHCNVMAWSDDREKLKRIKNDVGSQLALMEAKPRHNTVDVPTLFWAAIPGNAGDFPSEESFHTFIEQALCLFIGETSYKDSLSPFGIRMVDRLTGKPVHLDISDLPMKNGTITNRNKFILGPSGSGKSFFTNHMVRQYYEQGTHVLLVDTGNSYQGLCNLIHARTHGEDGFISLTRKTIRLPSIHSMWRTVFLTSRRRSPSRRSSSPCGSVTTSRRHVPRRWHYLMRSIFFWRKSAGTAA